MGYPRIEKSHTFTFVYIFLPQEHVSSMIHYLNPSVNFNYRDLWLKVFNYSMLV